MQVWIAALLLVAAARVIDTAAEKHLELEVGSTLQQPIPIIFLKYQHSSLVTIVKDDPAETRAPICEIRLK
jgi:hypothetical protein